MDFKFLLTYEKNGKAVTAQASNSDVEITSAKTENGLSYTLKTTSDIELVKAELFGNYKFNNEDKFFANGFQSWTDTKEFSKNETMPDKGFVAKTPIGKRIGLQYVGDYMYADYCKKPGIFHGNSYCYINKGNKIDFYGSLCDRTGWTVFEVNMNTDRLRIYKDVEGVSVNGEYKLFDLYFDSGEYDEVFDRYFNTMNVKPLTDEKIRGYTSWYSYYQNINEEVILRDLEALSEKADGLIDTFQIDDGYQVAVGEWLNINKKKFPNGMKPIADAIHKKGLQAGIWLAPLGVQHNSSFVKEHPDWFVRNKKGKLFYVGGNWGGFYALDIYNQEVRDYIHHFFDVVLNEWGFDLVKLDFLYAAAVLPRNGKSRGQIMYEAMDLIRECVGDKKILGCGVPMMPCFGVTEYMRVGADMGLQWEDSKSRKKMHREDVSTVNAIYNSIYRRHLNGRAFLCDPDVFLIRDYNISFSFTERKLLSKFIKIFGSVIFTSDDVSRYNEEQLACLNDTLSPDEAHLVSVDVTDGFCKIVYTENGSRQRLEFKIN